MADPIDFNGMSDEAFSQLDESAFIVDTPVEEEENLKQEQETDELAEGEGESVEEGEESLEAGSEEEEESTEEVEEGSTDELEGNTDEQGQEEEQEENKDETEETETSDVDAFHKAITTPFKANGVMHTIDNAEDVVRLMKMGLNYSKKMTVLKPHLNTIKMLDRQGLLEGDKLNFLIDLDKKDPKAIAKLVKDAGIDQYSLTNDDDGNEYSPKSYALSDEEVQLEDVIEDVKESEEGQRTLNIIQNEMDNESKQMLANSPQHIKLINEQVINGQYDQIMAEVGKERALGKLVGLSDLVAYDQVGRRLAQEGTLVGLDNVPEQKEIRKEVKQKKADNNSRKKAAGVGSKSPVKKEKKSKNITSIKSDDDFLKEFDNITL